MNARFVDKGSGTAVAPDPTTVSSANVLDDTWGTFDFGSNNPTKQVAEEVLAGSSKVKDGLAETVAGKVQSTVDTALASLPHPGEASDLSGFSMTASSGMTIGQVSDELAVGVRSEVRGRMGVNATSLAVEDRLVQEATLAATSLAASRFLAASERAAEKIPDSNRENLPPSADARAAAELPNSLDPETIRASDAESLRPRDPQGFADRRKELHDAARMSPEERVDLYREQLARARTGGEAEGPEVQRNRISKFAA